MEAFTPIPALIGGLMIGLGAAILWLGNGRIAGISGIFGQIVPARRTAPWRVVFLLALVAGAGIAAFVAPDLGRADLSAPAQLVGGPLWVAVAGLFVGLGTRIGSGCTSGHGVCGLARLSVRSATAVAVFFAVAIVTVSISGIV